MITKICTKCKKEKDITEFYKQDFRRDGLDCWCKKCHQKKKKIYYRNNKEKINKQCKEYNKKHPHKIWTSSTLYDHKKRGYIININRKTLEQLAKDTIYCQICGVKLNWNFGEKEGYVQMNSPTLDRKYNEKILNKNNIWIICNQCNITKSNRNIKELYKWCKNFINKFKNLKEEI